MVSVAHSLRACVIASLLRHSGIYFKVYKCTVLFDYVSLLSVFVCFAVFLYLVREAANIFKWTSVSEADTVTTFLLICQLSLTLRTDVYSGEINVSEPWQTGRWTPAEQ